MQTTPVPSKKSYFPFGFSDISLAGCLLRIGILLSFIAIMVAIIGACYFVYKYYTIAATLPDVAELKARASQFETTRILDRNGNTLYEILDPNAGRRTYVPLAKISPYVIATTIATVDEDFYKHPGYNPIAFIRALFQNLGRRQCQAHPPSPSNTNPFLTPEEIHNKLCLQAREIIGRNHPPLH
jgi:membrane peptidoglycan carboxypeptidase